MANQLLTIPTLIICTARTTITGWTSPDTPLVSASKSPPTDVVIRSVKAFLSPKATPNVRDNLICDEEIFAGVYVITTQKKIRPALLPIVTEVIDDAGIAYKGFVCNSSNQSGIITPNLWGDFTQTVYVVVSGHDAGPIPELFSKNAGKAFKIEEIETITPNLHTILRGDEENVDDHRILCLPVAIPVTYGPQTFRGSISEDCNEPMDENIDGGFYWAKGINAWTAPTQAAVLQYVAALGTKCPTLGARADYSKQIATTPFLRTGAVEEDEDDPQFQALEKLKRRLFVIRGTNTPTVPSTTMEIDDSKNDDVSAVTGFEGLKPIPRTPVAQLATYTEDEHSSAKLQIAFAAYNPATDTLAPGEISNDFYYVMACQGKENRNRALASALLMATQNNDQEDEPERDFLARIVDHSNYDMTTMANIINSRYHPMPWTSLEIPQASRATSFKIAYTAPAIRRRWKKLVPGPRARGRPRCCWENMKKIFPRSRPPFIITTTSSVSGPSSRH
jgi:hypothetical protein